MTAQDTKTPYYENTRIYSNTINRIIKPYFEDHSAQLEMRYLLLIYDRKRQRGERHKEKEREIVIENYVVWQKYKEVRGDSKRIKKEKERREVSIKR